MFFCVVMLLSSHHCVCGLMARLSFADLYFQQRVFHGAETQHVHGTLEKASRPMPKLEKERHS